MEGIFAGTIFLQRSHRYTCSGYYSLQVADPLEAQMKQILSMGDEL